MKWKEIGEVFLSYFTFPYYLIFPPKNSSEEERSQDTLETWV
jgi:hypothetical protein